MNRAALNFHHWMLREGWRLHSSGQYYYKDKGEWPPKQEDVKSEQELLDYYNGK